MPEFTPFTWNWARFKGGGHLILNWACVFFKGRWGLILMNGNRTTSGFRIWTSGKQTRDGGNGLLHFCQADECSRAREGFLSRSFQLRRWTPADHFASPYPVVKREDKEKVREKAWYEILLLSTLLIWDTFALVWFVCRGILGRKRTKHFERACWGFAGSVTLGSEECLSIFCRSARLWRMKVAICRNFYRQVVMLFLYPFRSHRCSESGGVHAF